MTPDQARVWRRALPIAVATAAYGVCFGALSVAAGLPSCRPACCP